MQQSFLNRGSFLNQDLSVLIHIFHFFYSFLFKIYVRYGSHFRFPSKYKTQTKKRSNRKVPAHWARSMFSGTLQSDRFFGRWHKFCWETEVWTVFLNHKFDNFLIHNIHISLLFSIFLQLLRQDSHRIQITLPFPVKIYDTDRKNGQIEKFLPVWTEPGLCPQWQTQPWVKWLSQWP